MAFDQKAYHREYMREYRRFCADKLKEQTCKLYLLNKICQKVIVLTKIYKDK